MIEVYIGKFSVYESVSSLQFCKVLVTNELLKTLVVLDSFGMVSASGCIYFVGSGLGGLRNRRDICDVFL